MAPSTSDLVMTPGGPRTADHIHTVQSGDIVEADKSGRFRITHRKRPDLARTRELLSTGLYEITPGGIRPKSMIHEVQPGEVVRPDGGVFKRFHLQSETFIEPPPVGVDPPHLPGIGSGWLAAARYVEPSTNVIRSMRTTWTVPPEPTREDGQLIYIFNGLQDSPVTHILQPVLQWGVSRAGGGNNWSVASWFVGSGDSFRTKAVEVQPGDVLTGLMKLLDDHAGNFFFYICEFEGIAATNLSINTTNQMVEPVQVLECYTVTECRDFPATLKTTMGSIDVSTANGSLALNFKSADADTDCGLHTTVTNNSAGAGQVDIYYTNQFTVPAPSIVTSISRSHDQIDLFSVGPDGSVDSTFWNADGGWFGRWFRLADVRFGDQFTVPIQSEITVLARLTDHLDLFTVGRDSAVYSTFWDGGSGWSNNWFRLMDSNFADGFKVAPRTRVSSLSRATDIMDLFVSGLDGGVYSTFWTEQGGWSNRWFRISDARFRDRFTVPPGTAITSVSRFREQIDLFTSGRDGGVYSTFWNAQGGWTGFWFRLGDDRFGDKFTVPPGSPVTTVVRFADQMDLFVSGRDGGVYTTFWNAQSGWANLWFRLGDDRFGDKFTVPPGSPVSAISRDSDKLDLFVSGKDGGVYTTFWTAQKGWLNQWFRLGDSNFWDSFTVPPGSKVYAQTRDPNIIDLFVVGRDGGVYTTFWTAEGDWPGRWFRL
jgi:hypothetical protein